MINFDKILSSIKFISEGIVLTLEISCMSVSCGLVLGTALALLNMSQYGILRILSSVYISIFRGTPLLIQLSLIYFAFPGIFGIKLTVFFAAVLSFSLNSGAYVSEIVRSGIKSIEKGQFEAAKVLGIPKTLMMRDIILPQAFRNILPALINEWINLIKESALISVIGGMDLMRRAQLVSTETYDYFTPMIIAGVIYYFVILLVARIAQIVENKISL